MVHFTYVDPDRPDGGFRLVVHPVKTRPSTSANKFFPMMRGSFAYNFVRLMKKILTARRGDAPVFSISPSFPPHRAPGVPTGHSASRAPALEAFWLKSPTPDGEKLICRGTRCTLLQTLAVLGVLAQVILMGENLGLISPLYAEESHPGFLIESKYAEAVIAFNKKQSDEALKILDEILKLAPNHVQVLELKALTLKTKGDDQKSMDVYARLVKLKPPAEQAPYHFELAMIYNRQKKTDLAKTHFEKAYAMNFNKVAAALFLGMISFNGGNLNAAEEYFSLVKNDGTPELKAVARYYLGLINYKIGYGAGGTFELLEASAIAADNPESKIAADIKQAADRILAPLNTGQWFGNLTLLNQYDSNISQIPSGLAATTDTSGKSTFKFTLAGGFGRMSSPMKTFQTVASFRGSINKNLNSQTKEFEFVSSTPALYLNYRPLARFNGGVKVEGNILFQNQPKDETDTAGAYVYRKYIFGAEAGPFFRYQVNRRLQTQLDIFMRPTKDYTDSTRSGTGVQARITIKGDSGSRFFNPSGTLAVENNRVPSTEDKYSATNFGFSNAMRLSSKDIVTLGVDYLLTKYPESALGRSDKNLGLRLSWIRSLTPKWALLGDVGYSKNTSTIPDSYSYDRNNVSLGISWSL